MENIDWDKIISDFKSYEGTISNFCKENNSKLQYQIELINLKIDT
ncbi:hypothetical protein P5F71_14160 [Clostridium perfringens]|nr:hypothetical protein [Clostridium perfringens]